MSRDRQEIYDDWFERQRDLLWEESEKIDDEDDPDKKLKLFDAIIQKAEKFVNTCEEKDLEPGIRRKNAKFAKSELEDLKQDKSDYIKDEYQDDLEWWKEYQQQKKEKAQRQKEAEKQQAEVESVKALIVSDLTKHPTLRIVDIEKNHPDKKTLIRKAISQLEYDKRIQKFKENNRLVIRLRSDYDSHPEDRYDRTLQTIEHTKTETNSQRITQPTPAIEVQPDKPKESFGKKVFKFFIGILIVWAICRLFI